MKARNEAYGCLSMIVLALALGVLLLMLPALAHSVKLDDGSEFYFDPYCCNQKDCQEVPLSAMTYKGSGWVVDYIDKDGKHVVGVIAEGTIGHKWSPNHQVFACRQMFAREDGTYGPRCIYSQKPGM